MLTRLKVSGFKNLVDVDVRFGPFTCIAGANGVGKSNLFDAITFLSALASVPLVEAAMSVRDEGGRTSDIRSLFHHVGDSYDRQMSFEAEMIIPSEGRDDLGQQAEAAITFVRYSLDLTYSSDDSLQTHGSLEITKEELVHINLGDARKNLLFDHKPAWRKSAVQGRRTSPFISTDIEGENRIIKRHQEGTSGRPLKLLASDLPRTALSATNAAESPTALLTRREMQSWRLLQLEPSALREPSEFSAPTKLGVDGSHLAAMLYRLGRDDERVYGQMANRLSDLIDDVRSVWVDRDDRRELLTLQVTEWDGTSHPAQALSDGTLRFLALAALELDPQTQGVLCLEEPENGIHPERIPAMLQLLQDIATDVEEPIDLDNPLRQVIVNTHSPSVVQQVDPDSLLVAELKEGIRSGQKFKKVNYSGLSDTWRHEAETNAVSLGKLLAYLSPVLPEAPQDELNHNGQQVVTPYRVIDRPDMRQLVLPFGETK